MRHVDVLFHARGAPPGDTATYVVLGSARGGTSMTAGVLRLLGIPMGDRLGVGNNEDLEFLVHEGKRHLFVDESTREPILTALRDVVRRRDERHRAWGWKDPFVHVYLPWLLAGLRRPRFIVIARDPIAVALKQRERVGTDPLVSLEQTLATYRSHRRLALTDDPPSLWAGYEAALRHPLEFVDAVAGFAGLRPTDEQRTIAAAYMNPARQSGNLALVAEDLQRVAQAVASEA